MTTPHHTLDTSGLVCPEPVMLLHKAMRKADVGDILEVIATDVTTTRDIPNFCHHLGHTLVSEEQIEGSDGITYHYLIEKQGL